MGGLFSIYRVLKRRVGENKVKFHFASTLTDSFYSSTNHIPKSKSSFELRQLRVRHTRDRVNREPNRIAAMAAVGFAGLLVVIMRSDEVKNILFDLVRSALTFGAL